MNAPTVFSSPVHWPVKINEIPKEIFERDDIFRLELERIFYGPEWHPVAHTGEIPNIGDFKTFHIGERPLLIARGRDDRVRVFYNACAHRGTLLETHNRGNKSEFECPYHRWLFDNTGALRGCPGKEDFSPSFRMENSGLAEVRSAEVGGLIFATLHDNTPDIYAWLGRTHDSLLGLLGGDGRLRLLGYQKVSYDCNWKIYADNDGYHAPLLHLAFKMLNWQGGQGSQYSTENGHIVFESELKVPSNPDFLKDPSLIAFKGTHTSKGSRIVSLNPTTVMTKHLDMINVRFAIARSPVKTEVHYAYFSHADDDADMVRHRLRQSSNMLGPCGMVSMEDASVFLRVQHGNRTPGNAVFQKGVKQEHGMWFDFKQNDEAGNLPRWDYYRRAMGFVREES